jgi:glycosyltransferase involved in cell wall biosynthesis
VRILFVNQQFQTPAGCSIGRGYEFVRQLQRHGHEVEVLCSGVETEERLTITSGMKFEIRVVETIPCVSIAAGWGSPIAITRVNKYRRMLGFLNFARLAYDVGKRLTPPDLIYATSPPLPIGLAGRRLARHFGVPFVFEVRDPWPQALIDLNALRNPLVIAWMRWMERRIYVAADHFIALSPAIKVVIASQGHNIDKISVVPNASDIHLFRPDRERTPCRGELGLDDRFAAIYFGAMGVANGLDYIVDAARILQQQGNREIVFVLVGTGRMREHLEARVRKENLQNVRFRDPVPRSQIPFFVAACDVSLIIIRPSTANPTWSPNKLFDSLAAGKPIITNVKGWIRELVESGQCGRAVAPEDPAELAAALSELAADDARCRRFGENARRLAERDYSRERLAARLERALRNVCHTTDQELLAQCGRDPQNVAAVTSARENE